MDTALNTFVGFNVIGLISLIPFIFFIILGFGHSTENAFFCSVIFTALTFVLIGGIRGKVVQKSLVRSGLSTLLIGGIAASLAHIVGYAT